ncbi:MAG: glycosyltransferase family 2 protein [Planctomycetes bacterium]|nr:glycosyltransferase family 2 protein [Planctomycetota bacterium]
MHVVPPSIAVDPQLQAPAQSRSPARLGVPRLSVVIVNYRQWGRTEELVRLLQTATCTQSGLAEIVIVDNHSPAHPVMKRLRRLPHVSLRRWDRNRGFARAVNEGCRLSRGDWFLLLNPDTTPSEEFLDGVTQMLDRLEPNAGIVGFHLRNSDGSRQLSAGPFPTLLSTLTRMLLPRSRRKYHTLATEQRCPAAWVTGCCLLVRGDCLRELGGLDEKFFLYYEDVDLCRRAQQRGWSVWYEPNLTVVHHHPLHQRAVPAVLRMVTRHSLMLYAAKHWPNWQFRALTRIVQAEAKVRRLAAWWSGDVQQKKLFAALGEICRDLRANDHAAAQQRIEQAIRHIDVRIGV